VTRSIAILRTLASSREPLGVTRIAHAIDAVPSTCLHILRALAEHGMVTFDRVTKKYTLGPGLLTFAGSYVVRNALCERCNAISTL
jgi:DNA-binding IclR family transcriptional regulator